MEERRKSMLTEDDRKFFLNVLKPNTLKFGLAIKDVVLLGGILVGVFAFYVRTNDAMDRLIKLGEYTQDFMTNSDAYHTEVLGIRFKQGKPASDNVDLSGIRRLLN